jgi:N-acyl-D-amino-acid deacylase
VGQDGSSPWPLPGYFEKLRANPPAVNVVTLAGHATIREQVMGADYKRRARPAENARMRTLMDEAMAAGAFGLSSGLEYEVGATPTSRVVEWRAGAKAATTSRIVTKPTGRWTP